MHVCLCEAYVILISDEFLHLGGMMFIAIPFLTYDGPAETDGK